MVEAQKRTSRPETGLRHVLAARACNALYSCLGSGGAAIKVPDANQPTVLLFLLAGQPLTPQAIDSLRQTLARSPGAQVVAVVTGSDATAEIKQLQADKVVWPIVADANHAACEKLGVHAWPTTVIVAADGTQVAHLAGLSRRMCTASVAFKGFSQEISVVRVMAIE